MSAVYRNRLVQINQVVFDQVDIFQSDFFNKVTGLQPSDVSFTLYHNNITTSWPLVDGSAVTDAQVVAGKVYWDELPNNSYGVRFFPMALGHWNLTVSFAPSPSQIISIDYDVVNLPNFVETGLRANFCS